MVTVMHNLLHVIYVIVHDHVPYREFDPTYVVIQDPQRVARRHGDRLEQFGYAVTITSKEAA